MASSEQEILSKNVINFQLSHALKCFFSLYSTANLTTLTYLSINTLMFLRSLSDTMNIFHKSLSYTGNQTLISEI